MRMILYQPKNTYVCAYILFIYLDFDIHGWYPGSMLLTHSEDSVYVILDVVAVTQLRNFSYLLSLMSPFFKNDFTSF